MKNKKRFVFSKEYLFKTGETLFKYGIFFLPTLFPLALILFFLSLLISISVKKIDFKNDRWNQVLLFSSGVVVFNSIRVILSNQLINNSDNFLIVIFNALKWSVLFLSFAAFQEYLITKKQKVVFVRFFILGSVPIILSCFLQYFFKVYGPFEILNGLIIWYNKPLDNLTNGVSGLFSNQNYTGFWLSIIWPFCVYFFKENRGFFIRRSLLTILCLSIIFLIFMTTSRASILGLLVSIPIIFSLKITSSLIFFILLSMLISNISFLNFNIDSIFIPQPIKYLSEKLFNINVFDFTSSIRIKIWTNTLNLIYSKPIFGFGAGLFPIIYLTLNEDYNAQHSHNIILQLAFDYGIFLSLLLSSFIFALLFKSWLKIFINTENYSLEKNSIEIFWFASSLVALVSQLYDVTFFEGKISLLIWIMLAGLKTIIEEYSQKNRLT